MNTAVALYTISLCTYAVTFFSALALITSFYLYSAYALQHSIKLEPWHPSLPVLTALIGLVAAENRHPALLVFFLILAIWLLVCIPKKKHIFLVHALCCSFICASTYMLEKHRYYLLTNMLSTHQCTVHAFVHDIQRWHRSKNGHVITLAVTHINYTPLTCFVRCYVHKTINAFVGDFIVTYRLQTNPPRHPEKAELRAFSMRENIAGTAFCPFLKIRTLQASHPLYWFTSWRHTVRKNLYEKLEKNLDQKTFIFLSALFFGNKNVAGFHQTKRQFARWGITHYLARSGLHIALLISLWSYLLFLIPIGFFCRNILLILLALLYTFFSWSSISFYRALWLWILYIGAAFSARRASPVYLLLHIVIALSLFNPSYLLCLDFQLSFWLAGTLSLINYFSKKSFLLASCAQQSK